MSVINESGLIPFGDSVLVLPDEVEEKTKQGIIIPKDAQERAREGLVLAVGEGKYSTHGELVPTQLKAGVRVLFGQYSGNEHKRNDIEYYFMRESDIFAIIEEKEEN